MNDPADARHDDPDLVARIAASIPDGPHRMTVGLRPLVPSAWIEEAPDHDAQLREKHRLLDTRDDVLAALPGTGAATAELLGMLDAHLARHLPHRHRANDCLPAPPRADDPDRPDNDAPEDLLRRAARLVPEDLCLMREDGAGRYRLVAAALCFPTRWRLGEKLGEPMDIIHAPVPGYDRAVGAATDRVMSALAPERPLWRQNWSLLDSPALYQPVRLTLHRDSDPADPGNGLWLRSERQTLRRLPASRDVVFTIRIRQCRLASACRVPGVAARLLAQIRSMPAALKRYKALDEVEPALIAWLESAQARVGEAPRFSPR